MAKLVWNFGTMSSGKSTALLQHAYNRKERDIKVIICTSALDDRYGVGKVVSRIGIESDARIIPKDDVSVLRAIQEEIAFDSMIKAVYIDESQFLSAEQVDMLAEIVDTMDCDVFCYGIRTDFTGKLFAGAEHLFAICDQMNMLPNICACGEDATMNARLVSGSEQVMIGGNDMYDSKCRKCYKKHLTDSST